MEEGAESLGTLKIVSGTVCIDNAFGLKEQHNGKGRIIWDNTVNHAYYLTEDGVVKNEPREELIMSNRSAEDLGRLLLEGSAIELESRDTANNQIISTFRK